MAIQGDAAYILTGTRLARLHRLEYAAASRKRHALEEQMSRLSREAAQQKGAEADALREQIRNLAAEQKELELIGIVWSTKTEDDQALLAAGNAVIVGGPNRVTAYASDDGSKLWSHELKGGARGLSAANGRLIVSTDAGAIYCFGDAESDSARLVTDLRPAAPANDPETILYRSAAAEILRRSGVTAGYCLVVGGRGRPAGAGTGPAEPVEDLLHRTRCREGRQGPRSVECRRLYGHRVAVHQEPLGPMPYSNYFADLIVSDTVVKDGALRCRWRHSSDISSPSAAWLFWTSEVSRRRFRQQRCGSGRSTSAIADQLELRNGYGWLTMVRGTLPGAGNWSHQYGNPANTAISSDKRIKGGLGVLWYGDPGPGEMVNRHDGAVGPLAVNGSCSCRAKTPSWLTTPTTACICGTYENPGAIRTGVFQNENPGNLAASDDRPVPLRRRQVLRTRCGHRRNRPRCTACRRRNDDGTHEWGYVAFRTACCSAPPRFARNWPRRCGAAASTTDDATDAIFAIDVDHRQAPLDLPAARASRTTRSPSGRNAIYFIDSSITSEQREAILRQDKIELEEAHRRRSASMAEGRLKTADVRLAVALDRPHRREAVGASRSTSPIAATSASAAAS